MQYNKNQYMSIGVSFLAIFIIIITFITTFSVYAHGAANNILELDAVAASRSTRYYNNQSLSNDAVNHYTFTITERKTLGLGVRYHYKGIRQHNTSCIEKNGYDYADLSVTLKDSSGHNEIAVSGPPAQAKNDHCRNQGFSVEWISTTINPGTYHIEVEALENGRTPYYIRFGLTDAPGEQEQTQQEQRQSIIVRPTPKQQNNDPDSTRSRATVLNAVLASVNTQYYSYKSLNRAANDTVDYYTFTTTERKELGLGIRGQSINLLATLEDNNGNTVAVSGPPLDSTKDQIVEWLKTTINPGTYYIKVEALEDGLTSYYVRFGLTEAPSTIVTEQTLVIEQPVTIEPETINEERETCNTLSDSGEETTTVFEEIGEDIYTYQWESDLNNREYECSSHVVKQREITFMGETLNVSNISATDTLEREYNILLSNEEMTWSPGFARGVLRAVSNIPHRRISKTSFVLVDQEIANDIRIDGKTVYLSKHAFTNANPRMVLLDGRSGMLFSHRVFHALTRFYTNNGANRQAVEKILKEKFGVKLRVPNIRALTGEHPDNFQEFQNEEVLDLISALAETPEGQYIIPGLTYILRRKDGHPHPLYPGAPAVAWARGAHADGYIEFMETAFYSPEFRKKMSEGYIHRLILHEKAHFLWRNVLSSRIRNEWINVAGWYRNEDDPDDWSTRYTTTFVGPYAHGINPNEDLAESISHFITNPNRLLNVAPEKYEFIKKHIMYGNEYILDIREDLKFEVLNLFPDYDYPGKIKKVSVTAKGSATEDKKVTIELTLHNAEGYNDGAHWARTRLTSESGIITDLYMYPTDGSGHKLRGKLTIPKNSESGYWRVDQITVLDLSGNTRMEGIVDFGFMLYINNSDVDLTAPKYVPNSLEIQVEEVQKEGRNVHKVTATWDIIEEGGMEWVYANFVSLSNPEAYSWGEYGKAHNNKAKVIFYITEYYPSGQYTINYLKMTDAAWNTGGQYFSDNPRHERQKIFTVETANPDTIMPTLDVNRIYISAIPFNEKSPDGKTRVTITYYAKDDSSGVGKVYYTLQNPNGKTFTNGHYHENFYSLFFEEGDPTEYKKYTVTHILPTGSTPGTWGLSEMIVEDKGGNIAVFDFTEILHFELDEDTEE